MKTYIIQWSRNDYGRLHIKANNEEEARELFETGEFHDKDMNVKGGDMELNSIEEYK